MLCFVVDTNYLWTVNNNITFPMRTVGKISPAKGKVHLSYLVKEMGILLLYIILTNIIFELCLHLNYSFPLYPACNLTSSIQIKAYRSKYTLTFLYIMIFFISYLVLVLLNTSEYSLFLQQGEIIWRHCYEVP